MTKLLCFRPPNLSALFALAARVRSTLRTCFPLPGASRSAGDCAKSVPRGPGAAPSVLSPYGSAIEMRAIVALLESPPPGFEWAPSTLSLSSSDDPVTTLPF